MVKEQEEGRRPINRAYTWREQERREGKCRKKNTWFKGGKGKFTSVMFCPHTPGGELAKRWRKVEERGAASRGWRFRMVELGGRKISSTLCGDPWQGPCGKDDCLVCSTGSRGPCGRPGCTYDIISKTCETDGPSTVPDREYEDDNEEEEEREEGPVAEQLIGFF